MNTSSIVHSLLSHEPARCEDTEAEMVVLSLATDHPSMLRRVMKRLAACGGAMRASRGLARDIALADMPDDTTLASVSVGAHGVEMAFPLDDGTTLLHVRHEGNDMFAWVS